MTNQLIQLFTLSAINPIFVANHLLMKKFYASFISLFIYASAAHSQTTVLSANFDTYDGTTGNIPAGFYISWNSTSPVKSFYDTISGPLYCGLNCNAYKFGVDSATIITPAFTTADSVSFYLKGNGTPKDSNTFYVYASDDSIIWNEIFSMDSISPSSQYITLPVTSSAKHLKFYYWKPVSGYNAGFDDLLVVNNSVGVNEHLSASHISLYPNPSSAGIVRIVHRNLLNPAFELWDMLGNRIHHITLKKNTPSETLLDFSSSPKGVYFLKVKSNGEEAVKKIVRD